MFQNHKNKTVKPLKDEELRQYIIQPRGSLAYDLVLSILYNQRNNNYEMLARDKLVNFTNRNARQAEQI